QSDTAEVMGDTAAKVYADAFDRAVATKQGDLARKTATDTSNASFMETALGRLLGGTGAAVSQEGASQGNLLQALQAMLTGGQMQTAQQQAELDANKAQHDETYIYQLS